MKKEPTVPPPADRSESKTEESSDNGTQHGIRYATKEEFEKAQRKTSILHAGLFRRLAK